MINFKKTFEFSKSNSNLILSGFSMNEAWGTWINGNKASIQINNIKKKNHIFVFNIRCFMIALKSEFSVKVLFNGKSKGYWVFSKHSKEWIKKTILISKDEITSDTEGMIEFEINKPESPLQLGVSNDSRFLSIGIKSINIIEIENLSYFCLLKDIIEEQYYELKGLNNKKSIFDEFTLHYPENERLVIRSKHQSIKRLPVSDFYYWQDSYKMIEARLKNKIKKGGGLRVAFLVNLANTFPARHIYENMVNSKYFDPFILVVPFEPIIKKERYSTCKRELNILKNKYEKVFCAWDFNKNLLIDFKKEIDIIFLPSAAIKNQPVAYQIFAFMLKEILTVFIDYTYLVQLDGGHDNSEFSNLVWKNFVQTDYHYKNFIDNQDIRAVNVTIVGYPKMDKFNIKRLTKENSRKKIIIAPHHSVHGIGLNGQFIKYHCLFNKLPKLYPCIDFIFRPHPLLNTALLRYWSVEKIDEYWSSIKKEKNCFYDESDEYHDLFINSHGIIHDCGSFLPEYLYTDNPPCYLLENKESIETYFNDIGIECLKNYYHAYNELDILKYIDEVVVKNNDRMKDSRLNFANKKIKIKHPTSSKTIIKIIERSVGII